MSWKIHSTNTDSVIELTEPYFYITNEINVKVEYVSISREDHLVTYYNNGTQLEVCTKKPYIATVSKKTGDCVYAISVKEFDSLGTIFNMDVLYLIFTSVTKTTGSENKLTINVNGEKIDIRPNDSISITQVKKVNYQLTIDSLYSIPFNPQLDSFHFLIDGNKHNGSLSITDVCDRDCTITVIHQDSFGGEKTRKSYDIRKSIQLSNVFHNNIQMSLASSVVGGLGMMLIMLLLNEQSNDIPIQQEPTKPVKIKCPDIDSILLFKKRSDSAMSGSMFNLAEIEIYDANGDLIPITNGSVFPQYGKYGVGNLYDRNGTTFAHTTDSLDFSYIHLALPTGIKNISKVFIVNREGGTDARAVGIQILFLSSHRNGVMEDTYDSFLKKQQVLLKTELIKTVSSVYEFKFENTDSICNNPIGVFDISNATTRNSITHIMLYNNGNVHVDRFDAYYKNTQLVPISDRLILQTGKNFSYVVLKLASPMNDFHQISITPSPNKKQEILGCRVMLLSKFTELESETQTSESFLSSQIIESITDPINTVHSKYTLYYRYSSIPGRSLEHVDTIVSNGVDIVTSPLQYPINKPTEIQVQSQTFISKTLFSLPGDKRASKIIGMCSRGDYIFTMTDEKQSDGSFIPYVVKINTITNVVDKQELENGYRSISEGHHSWIIGIDRANYIHVIGDMHNGKARTGTRWEGNSIMYWRSSNPMGLNFEFLGKTGGRTIELNAATYYEFYYSITGQLWLMSRIRANVPSREAYFSCIGVYKYHEDTLSWQTIGELAPITDGSTKIFFGSPTGGQSNQGGTWYQNGKARLFFDALGVIHWTYVNNDDDLDYNNIIVYAKSKDDGETWEWIDGTRIKSLPITTNKGMNPGEIVDETLVNGSERFHDACGFLVDLSGRVAIFARPLPAGFNPKSMGSWNPNKEGLWYYLYDPIRSKWIKERVNAYYYVFPRGYMGADGVVTFIHKFRTFRTLDITYESNYHDITPNVRELTSNIRDLILDNSEWYNPLYTGRIRFIADTIDSKDFRIIEYIKNEK